MPGYDGTGPMGAGPMTGGRRGFCHSGRAEIERSFPGRYGFGMATGSGYGLRSGYGSGGGFRKGFCKGFTWYPPFYGPEDPLDRTAEIHMLKAQADYLKNTLDSINKRLEEIEKSSE